MREGVMHVMFVDESGDVGAIRSPTRHFVLSAVVVDHVGWAEVGDELRSMRARLCSVFGLAEGAEIHASEFLGGSPLHLGLDLRRRYLCALQILRTLRHLRGARFARVAVDKAQAEGGILDLAWGELLHEVNSDLGRGPSTGCPSRGIFVVCDHHSALPYRPSSHVLARMHAGAPLLDHPYGRDSRDNLMLQVADLLAYLTKQSIEPGVHFRRSRSRALVRESERLFAQPCRVITA